MWKSSCNHGNRWTPSTHFVLTYLFSWLIYSLQFDPAPREGEPQVSRRTPGLLSHLYNLQQTTSSNAYPYTVEAAFACEWRLLKREESNLFFLFVNTYSYPLLCYLHLCWFIAGRWIGYNVIYTVVPHKNVKNINSAMDPNSHSSHITLPPHDTA